MKTIDIYIMEDLNKEWTKFLDGFLWNEPGTVAEINRRFERRRAAWLKRMSRSYDVSMSELEDRYVH